jgi:excisionase family DNA binding protein
MCFASGYYKPIMDRRTFKTNEAANYLGVSRSSLTNWARQGLIGGGSTPGGHYRFTQEELDGFAEGRGLSKGASPLEPPAPVKLLVIDDDEPFRAFVKEALEIFGGYELKEASDGMTGALLVGSWHPDLVVLDVRMPNLDGVELLRRIRQTPETADTAVLVASAHLSQEVRAEIERLGAELILEKPVRLAKLVAAMQSCVELELL